VRLLRQVVRVRQHRRQRPKQLRGPLSQRHDDLVFLGDRQVGEGLQDRQAVFGRALPQRGGGRRPVDARRARARQGREQCRRERPEHVPLPRPQERHAVALVRPAPRREVAQRAQRPGLPRVDVGERRHGGRGGNGREQVGHGPTQRHGDGGQGLRRVVRLVARVAAGRTQAAERLRAGRGSRDFSDIIDEVQAAAAETHRRIHAR